jgi:hypothetical protein
MLTCASRKVLVVLQKTISLPLLTCVSSKGLVVLQKTIPLINPNPHQCGHIWVTLFQSFIPQNVFLKNMLRVLF